MTETPSPLAGPSRVLSDDAMRRWRRRRRRLRRRLRRAGDVALVLLAIAAIVFAVHKRSGGGHAKAPTTTFKAGTFDAKYPPGLDAVVQRCAFYNFSARGQVFVYNHTPKAQRYYVDVVFKNGPRKYAEGVAKSDVIAPKGHAFILAIGATRADAPKHLKCTIGSVDRFVDPGLPK
jgi:hypothetical protein